MQHNTPVRMAIAGLSHNHVIWLLRNWRRKDLEIVGFWDDSLVGGASRIDIVNAERYAMVPGYLIVCAAKP